MKKSIISFGFVGSLLVLFLTSCGSISPVYTPPALPEKQLAKIRETEVNKSFLDKTFVTIETIDGARVKSFSEAAGLNLLSKEAWLKKANKSYALAPGRHVLKVKYDKHPGYAHGEVSFIAKAGRSYQLIAGLTKEQRTSIWSAGSQYVLFFVKDEATGKVVSELE